MEGSVVAIYVRVSTEKQEAENQLRDLREYCQKRNWTVYKEYVDIISGKEKSRPAFNQMFLDAHQRQFDIVLFWDMSRFSRSGLSYTLQKLTELQNAGVGWHSYTEPHVNTSDELVRNIVLAVLSSIAKAEREKISERTKAGLRLARARGTKLGRPRKRPINEPISEAVK